MIKTCLSCAHDEAKHQEKGALGPPEICQRCTSEERGYPANWMPVCVLGIEEEKPE